MRTLLLPLIFLFPFLSFSQYPAMSLGFVYDHHNGSAWKNDRGLQVGIGIEDYLLGESSLTLSARLSAIFTKAPFYERIDSIAFEMPDELPDAMGYGSLDLKKMRFGLEFDLGYQDWEYAVVEPYVSLGMQLEHYGSWVKYNLYEVDTCHCFTSTPKEITETTSLGFKPGVGVKIKPFDLFTIDFRASYYGGWTINKGASTTLPNTDSFYMGYDGIPTADFSPRRFNHGFTIRVGLIFNLASGGSGGGSSYYDDGNDSYDDVNDDDYDDYTTPDYTEPSGRTCDPIELTPSGGRVDPPE